MVEKRFVPEITRGPNAAERNDAPKEFPWHIAPITLDQIGQAIINCRADFHTRKPSVAMLAESLRVRVVDVLENMRLAGVEKGTLLLPLFRQIGFIGVYTNYLDRREAVLKTLGKKQFIDGEVLDTLAVAFNITKSGVTNWLNMLGVSYATKRENDTNIRRITDTERL